MRIVSLFFLFVTLIYPTVINAKFEGCSWQGVPQVYNAKRLSFAPDINDFMDVDDEGAKCLADFQNYICLGVLKCSNRFEKVVCLSGDKPDCPLSGQISSKCHSLNERVVVK